MSLWIVWLNDEVETLLFVTAPNKNLVEALLLNMSIRNYHIRGTIAHQDMNDPNSVGIFEVDKTRLKELATTFDN